MQPTRVWQAQSGMNRAGDDSKRQPEASFQRKGLRAPWCRAIEEDRFTERVAAVAGPFGVPEQRFVPSATLPPGVPVSVPQRKLSSRYPTLPGSRGSSDPLRGRWAWTSEI